MWRTYQGDWHRADPKYTLVSLLHLSPRALRTLNKNGKGILCTTHDWGGRKCSFCWISHAAPGDEGINRMELSSPPHTHLLHNEVVNFYRHGLSLVLPHGGKSFHKALGESSGQKMLHEYQGSLPIPCSIRYELWEDRKYAQLQNIISRKLTCSSFS